MIEQMKKLAKKHNVELTEFAPKIVKAREFMGITIDICPCAAEDMDRGCISAKCLREIKEQGECHCRAFRRK